jgi:hypothetical protein
VRATTLVAFDAIAYGRDAEVQFRPRAMLRELTKAYAAFVRGPADPPLPIATGALVWTCRSDTV